MATFQLQCEFDIVRRIGWSNEDLGLHIDDVFNRLQQARVVLAMEADADLDTGRALIAIQYDERSDDSPEHTGRATLGVAIRSSGGGHGGLLPFAEEASMKPERNSWSGLRTPTWNVRQVTMTKVVPAG
jgi:hypothetical protein